MTTPDQQQMEAVIALAMEHQEAAAWHMEQIQPTHTAIRALAAAIQEEKNETTERNKIFQNSMNVYVQRLYEAAAAHADARWKREAIIERAIYAISVIILLIAVGIASYDQGEKSGATKAIPAVVQTAPT
jgi:hypothetical protein